MSAVGFEPAIPTNEGPQSHALDCAATGVIKGIRNFHIRRCQVGETGKVLLNQSLIQGATQKFLDNCYKTQITSYMDMIYFYSSKYVPP